MNESWLKVMEHEELKWVRAVYTVDTTFSGKFFEFLRSLLQYWTGGDRLNREKLIQAMREPLCDFLGETVPTMPVPNINKGDGAVVQNKARARARANALLIDMVRQPALNAALLAVVAIGAWVIARGPYWRTVLGSD